MNQYCPLKWWKQTCVCVCPGASLAESYSDVCLHYQPDCKQGLNKVTPIFLQLLRANPFKAAAGNSPAKDTTPLQSPKVTTECVFYLFPSGNATGNVQNEKGSSHSYVLLQPPMCGLLQQMQIFVILFHTCIMHMWSTLLNHEPTHHLSCTLIR